mgnify:CR=1 FL=1
MCGIAGIFGLNGAPANVAVALARLGADVDVAPLPSVILGAVELTPLEVAQIYQSFAASGYSVPLRAVVAVQTATGDELVRYPIRMMPQPHREAIALLNFALTQVVEQGTAARLPALLGSNVTVAGKTGTAQVFGLKEEEKYDAEAIDEKLRDHSLFIAFAPVEEPVIAVAVIVENGGSGSAVAAPIARTIMDAWLLDNPA